MGTFRFLLWTLPVWLAACGGTSDETPPPDIVFTGPTSSVPALGPQPFLVDAAITEHLLSGRIAGVFDETGAFPYDALPTTGSAVYRGILTGRTQGPVADPLFYVADLTINVLFEADTIIATAENFATSLFRFEQPGGSILLTGRPLDDGGAAGLSMAGFGSLVGGLDPLDTGGVPPLVSVSIDATGQIGGPGGSVALGTASASFQHAQGPYLGAFSQTEGTWHAE